jgi:hypothetical protein
MLGCFPHFVFGQPTTKIIFLSFIGTFCDGRFRWKSGNQPYQLPTDKMPSGIVPLDLAQEILDRNILVCEGFFVCLFVCLFVKQSSTKERTHHPPTHKKKTETIVSIARTHPFFHTFFLKPAREPIF